MLPEKIGRYIILSELGRGGMATVYHAKDPYFDRDVAVKILPHTFLHDPQFRVRFEREAKTIAALEHAAIVPVYDFGEDEGQPFIVMRLMSGGSLADKLVDAKLSLEESVRVITQLAPGLDAAHKSGIVHRDLKPGNILFDQYNNAYLSDFGIARLKEGDSTLTGSRILGTPAYMSPEQIQGNKSIDNRSDLYAMGVIFYQMLVGNTPFQATTPAKVMMMHILEPVPNLLSALPTVPISIETWLERVLAKDPDDRFLDAIEMSTALQAAMQGKAPSPPQKTVVAPAWSEDSSKQTINLNAPATVRQAYDDVSQIPPQAPPDVYVPPVSPVAKPAARSNRLIRTIIGFAALLGIGAIAIIGLVVSGLNGKGPLALLASATPTREVLVVAAPTDTPKPTQTEQNQSVIIEASPTPEEILPTGTEALPSPTLEPSPTTVPELPVVGGADKIAFTNANDIWLMNVDGSDLHQMTTDRAEKRSLGWLPDGSAITYISGKCIWMVGVETGIIDQIACFESGEYLENFSFSPDGTQVAISLNRELYVVPFDLERLQAARFNSDLKAMSECPSLAPITSHTNIKIFRWAKDGERVIIIRLANVGGLQGDLIQILQLQGCNQNPYRIDEIPAARFELENYNKNPIIQNFGFDGDFLMALVSYTRNGGYGHLYIYNTTQHRVDLKVNPINGECCYRDVQFSPDGRYLILVFQPYEANARSQLFYIPYGTIGTGASYDPIPLPESFFENSREQPQPVLRPAQ
jgi:serine/threonine protein kinase